MAPSLKILVIQFSHFNIFFSLDVEGYLSNLRKEQENILSHMAFTSDIANVKVKLRKCGVLRIVETFYKSLTD